MLLQSANHWACDLRLPTPRRRPDVTSRLIDGEAVLFDRATQRTHRMNETALVIWDACDGQRTTDDVARELADRFEVARDRALVDVEQVLAAFAQSGLVETVQA